MINYSYIFHFVTALGMVTLFMFVDFNTISPGANDNLTGTYAAVCALLCLIWQVLILKIQRSAL